MDKNAISNLCKLVSGVIRTGKRGKLSTTEIVILTSVGSASKPVDMFWLERVSGVSYASLRATAGCLNKLAGKNLIEFQMIKVESTILKHVTLTELGHDTLHVMMTGKKREGVEYV